MVQSKATIQVNTKSSCTTAINPYLFGHFVEDIRDHMEAMLAYPLRDMDFESEDVAYRGLSGSWRPYTNGKSTVYGLEPAAAYHSGHSQMLRIYSDDNAYAGVSQAVAVKQDQSGYALSLYARASVDIKYVLAEIVNQRTGEVLGQVRIDLESHDWRAYDVRLQVEQACEQAEFRLYVPAEHPRWLDHVSTGMLWLDHISLLPSGSAGNVRREVMEMTRSLNAGMMRLAGNYISAYHWQQAIGPVYERPCLVNEAWGGWTSKYFGTDEFIAFCRELNVEPLICVNDGSGTPEEAAEWIEYCNGDATTPMGRLRAANGHPEPYGVKYWEIGNEVWGPWQVGHCNAEQFAERYVRFAVAMKTADPGIRLLACGDDKTEGWNATVLARAAEHIDYLTLHLYHGCPRFGMNHKTPGEERFKAIVSYPEWTRETVSHARTLIGSSERYAHVKLAITEYNTMYYPNTIRKGLPNEHTLEAAAANAANLNEFIRSSDLIEIGSFSDLVNGWLGGCIRVGDYYADQFRGKSADRTENALKVYGSPTYYVMQMYANRDLGFVVESKTDCASFGVKGPATGPKLDELPVLDVVASINKDRNKLTVFIVNRSLEEQVTDVNIGEFALSGTARLTEITGDHFESFNAAEHPEDVVSSIHEVSVEHSVVTCLLRPSSVYALEVIAPHES
ncbi:alpha-L-arabinofuranosidase C-terminal domain-containing protein [Paenibacillus oryzisoli]|uniref:alpha-L-arabinofuranosidase C-terminal domain-containing protein n=1 Tax=Paenibacillus oryzisoli TaxID=1850517 RepID=UPI003D299AF2